MKRATRIIAVLVAGALAACFTKPDPPQARSDAGGSGMDARKDAPDDAIDAPGTTGADAFVPCATTSDNFDTDSDCGTWGTGFGTNSPIIGRDMGALSVTPSLDGSNGCGTNNPFKFSKGTTIKIVRAASSGMPEGTFFKVISGANSGEELEVLITTGGTGGDTVAVRCNGSTTNLYSHGYLLPDYLWWKISIGPGAQSDQVHASFSSDGGTWTSTGATCSWMIGDSNTVNVQMGTLTTADGGPTPALFDDFNIKSCPLP